MRRHNPAFIPRNHKVEEALLAATSSDDLTVMERLLEVLAAPYDHDAICRCSARQARAIGPIARSVARSAQHPWSGSGLPGRAESTGPACYAFALFLAIQQSGTSSTTTSGPAASNSSLARQE